MSRKVFTSGSVKGYHLGGAGKALPDVASPEKCVPYNNEQSFQEIHKQCATNGTLFEDPHFPATDEKLFFSKKPPRPFIWKRPSEIVANPNMFVGGASRFDIAQGMLGDCWLLAAVASLTQYQGLLNQVVPPDNTLDPADARYCGAVRFRFWQYGRWEEVTVDDRLPTYNNKLVFLHSESNNEFWSSLLEKAYAKLCGTYEALKGGQTSEAMEDFTGGVTETFLTAKQPPRFFKLLEKATDRQSLMCCSIEAKPNEIEAELGNGLVKGHAYTVTGIKRLNNNELIRVRNPWGNEKEWTGDFSDTYIKTHLGDEDKKALEFDDGSDGEFWMTFADFCANFSKLEVCMLSPDSSGDSDKKTWEMQVNQGSWQNHVSAGGCRNFPETFHYNPQYRVTLEDPDDDDEVDNCTIVIGCIQKGRRKIKNLGSQNLTIGFSIYQLEEDHQEYIEHDRLNKDFFLYHKSFARSENFVNSREVTGRFSLPPGEYVIIPSTFKSGEEGDFVMRMFSEKAQKGSAMDTATTIDITPEKKLSEAEQEQFDAKMKPFFSKVAGSDQEINAFELLKVLQAAFKAEIAKDSDGGFSLESCRTMIAMEDQDRNGTLDYEEFSRLWRTIMKWRAEFNAFDKNGDGTMDAIEMRNVLAKLGFKLSTSAISSVALRYANKSGTVDFDDFMQICCRVKGTFKSYLAYQGRSFSLDDYIVSALYT